MEKTTNYLFNAPERTDFVDIELISENFVALDQILKKLESALGTSSLKLQVGGENPGDGPWIWFDNQMTDVQPEQEIVLVLTEGSDGEVQAEVDGKNYNVENATLDEQQITANNIFVDVID